MRLRWSCVFHRSLQTWNATQMLSQTGIVFVWTGFWVPAATWGFLFWISPNPEKVSSCSRWTQTEAALFIWHAALDLQVTFKSNKHSTWVDAAWCSTHRCCRGAGASPDCWWSILELFWAHNFPLSLLLSSWETDYCVRLKLSQRRS